MLVGLAPMASAEDPEWTTVTTAEQLDAAIEAGGQIKLGADYMGDSAIKRGRGENRTVPPILTISKDVTLDLNGNTLELKCGERVEDPETHRIVDNRNTYGIYLTNGATLTVMDSSQDANGLITTDCYYLVGVDYDDEKGESLVLESGTMKVTSNWGNIISSLDPLSSVEVTGGTMVEDGFRTGLVFNQGSIRISGGTFISTAGKRPSDISASYGEDIVKGLHINRPDFQITGGYFNCEISVFTKGNGKVTGGYFRENAFNNEGEIFNNSGYELVQTTENDGVDLNIYTKKVVGTDDAVPVYVPGTLYVGGVKMAPASSATEADPVTNPIKVNDQVVASYDEATHTLTLTDYNYKGNWSLREKLNYNGELYDVSAGIYYTGGKYDENLTIVLEGENSIVMEMPNDTDKILYDLSAAVCINGAHLTIQGGKDGGTLTATGATGGKNLAESAGIFVEEYDTDPKSNTEYGGNLTIENCTVEATGGSADGKGWYEEGESEGIYAEGDVVINDAEVTAKAGEAARNSIGIETDDGKATFTNSVVNATAAAEEKAENSYGIYVYRTVEITDSEVTGTAANATRYSDGIFFDDIAVIKNSTVTGTSGAGGDSSAGLYADAELKINNSEVTGTSTDTKQGKSHGIHAKYRMLVDGGSKVTGTAGDSSDSNSYGVNVDGVLGIDGKSTLTGTAGTAQDVSCGADVDSILAISEGSTLTGTGDTAKTSIGVRCGVVASEVTGSEETNPFAHYYNDYIVPEGCGQTLAGAIVAQGAESADNSYGMVLLPFIGDVEKAISDEELEYAQEEYAECVDWWKENNKDPIPFLEFLQEYLRYSSNNVYQVGDKFVYSTKGFVKNDSLNVTGALLAQGVSGGLQCAGVKKDANYWNSVGEVVVDEYFPVTLTADSILAGEKYDGSDKASQTSPLTTDGKYQYISQSCFAVAVAPITGGTVATEQKLAEVGALVTFTVKPDDSNTVDKVTVTDKDGNPVEVKYDGDSTYSFTMPNSDVTINATFQKKEQPTPTSSGGGGTTTYKVNALASVDNGTITVSPTNAAKDKTVTITPKPDKGYKVDSVKVTDKDGKEVPVKDNGDGTYSFTMPSSAVTVTPVFTKIEASADDVSYDGCPKDSTCPISKFSDASPTAWYHDGVHYVLDEGIMQGIAADKFAPNAATNRAMIVTMLWRMEGEPVSNYAMSFADVPADVWYTESVRWAAATELVKGYSDTAFGPMDNVTREQLAAILYRYAQLKGADVSVGEDTNILSFDDVSALSQWAYPAMQWAVGAQLIQGKGNESTLAPKANATRAEVATMLMRFAEAMEHE